MALSLEDITKGYSPDAGAEMDVRGPDGHVVKDAEGVPARIRLAGVDSEVYREARAVLAQRKQRMLQDRRNSRLSPEEEDAQSVEMAARCTLGWSNLDVPFSIDKARELYAAAPYIRDDALLYIHTRENYLQD